MNSDERLKAWEFRKDAYANHWKVGLCAAPCEDCPCCCLVLFCPYCAAYSLRKRTLYNDMTRYQCCGGFMPCSGRCLESNCPELCLCLESCCCFAMAVSSTRWLIQDELHIQNSQCDNCILTTTFLLQQLACICRLAARATGNDDIESIADTLSLIAEIVWWSVCACTQTQHKIQLDDRDRAGSVDAQPTFQPPMPPMPPPSGPYDSYPPSVSPAHAPPGGSGYPSGGYSYQPPSPGYPAAQPPGYNPQMYR